MPFSFKPAVFWLIFILLAAVGLVRQTVLQPDLPIETNILALLPENQQDPFAQQAFEQVSSNLSNKVVFLLSSEDKKQLAAAASDFSDKLLTTNLFSGISAQLSSQEQQAWAKLYFPYRAQLLTAQQKESLQQDPQAQVTKVLQQVYNPFSGVTGGELKNDPFLLFRDYISSRNNSSANFTLYQGYLTTEYQGKYHIIIRADLAGDPYDTQLQNRLSDLTELETRIKTKFHVELAHTGTIFYASYGTQSAKSEISTIGLGSLIGVVLLLLIVYRSALPLTLALLSISSGLLVAFVVTAAVFGKVHLFSLVFGASLIGVSIDYAFHYLTERLVQKDNWHSQSALKHIFNAITLGLLTSLIGYLGLLIAPFPGLQQLSLFSVVGLLGAYLTVVCWYPLLAKSASTTAVPKLGFIILWLKAWQNPKFKILLPSFLLLFSLIGAFNVHFDDDIRQLQALPETLKAQETYIKTVSGAGQSQQLLLVKAASDEDLLIRLSDVGKQLTAWQKQDLLVSYQSISQYVPSLQSQKENFELVKSLYQSQAQNISNKLNFSQVVHFDQPFKSLLVDDYLASSVSEPLGFLWLDKINGQSSAVILVNDMHDKPVFQSYINEHDDITSLDKANEVSTIFGTYRVHISKLLIGAYLLITVLMIWRYGLKLGFLVISPPVIAACVGLAVTSVSGIPITIFNLLAVILILGIGIDYTLFFAEQKKMIEAKNTLLAITLSALTTVLSFGLLALSETQAIHGFGITVLTGIIVAWLLAPLAMSGRKEKR
ncbi:MMPL family transporter [Psychromonas ossibalaenae]|uniref:MMPL family transporter n=1 Tax=Psychromonas ossibalaenae TaxID=444922 RepID=UPI0003672557|nr:MMPL family transporter [Psychromonas ossibalaenae]